MSDYKQLSIDRTRPGVWEATFSNPPINLLDAATTAELRALISAIETDISVKVVIFQTADPDFFIAHFDTPKSGEALQASGASVTELWIDFVLRLSNAPVVSIAKVRGRARGEYSGEDDRSFRLNVTDYSG